jgi:hypothetical protein
MKYSPQQELAEMELAEWAYLSSRRDEVITRAWMQGVSKYRINLVTGIARTTIDRILKNAGVRV